MHCLSYDVSTYLLMCDALGGVYIHMYVGLFEVSVTRWMALAYCHTKWRKVKYVA